MPSMHRNVRTPHDLNRHRAQQRANCRAMRVALPVALLVFAACGGSTLPVEHRAPVPPVGDASVPDTVTAAGSASAPHEASVDAGEGASERADEKVIDAEGRRVILKQAWEHNTPNRFRAVRTICLPKGRYIFELSSQPTEDIVMDVNGKPVIDQSDYPTEISKPTEVEGCAKVEVRFKNPLHFPRVSFQVTVRPTVEVQPPCDEALFPKGSWNACLYQGHNQAELLGRETWTKLVVPKQKEGPNGQFDWMSIVARTTVCFPKGNYRFHSTSDDSLKVYVGETLAIDAPPTRRFPVMESKVMPLEGCKPLRVVHTYRNGMSTLELAWAKVGSAIDKGWGVERACDFKCIDQTRCVDGNTLPAESEEVKGKHVCVPFGRASHLGEYCDANHKCTQSFCVHSHCWED